MGRRRRRVRDVQSGSSDLLLLNVSDQAAPSEFGEVLEKWNFCFCNVVPATSSSDSSSHSSEKTENKRLSGKLSLGGQKILSFTFMSWRQFQSLRDAIVGQGRRDASCPQNHHHPLLRGRVSPPLELLLQACSRPCSHPAGVGREDQGPGPGPLDQRNQRGQRNQKDRRDQEDWMDQRD